MSKKTTIFSKEEIKKRNYTNDKLDNPSSNETLTGKKRGNGIFGNIISFQHFIKKIQKQK